MAALAIAVLAFLCAFPAYFGTNGAVAYAAVTSIATIGLYIAYAIPIFLRLRLGDAGSRASGTSASTTSGSGSSPCLWVVFISILFMVPLSPAGIPWNDGFTWLSVNYAPIAVLGTLLLVGGWWLLSANKWFKGPISQGTPEELARIEAQYEQAPRPRRTSSA